MRDTSQEARKSINGKALRSKVLAAIERRGTAGATSDELEQVLSLPHQTVSARVHELGRAGIIHDSGRRRPTRSGRKAIAWCVQAP